jgi:putative glutamine amidotransferase
MQTLNVTRGGTLHQHLDQSKGIAHRQNAPAEEPTHTVRIDGSSRLAEVMGSDSAEVNSFHHQAVDWLGSEIRPVAWAPDGVVEGFQAEDREFVLGVQWHAECLTGHPEQLALFGAFVEAAAARAPVGQEA